MRVVVKVGTSSLTNTEGHIKTEVIQLVSQQLAAARAQGHEVLLVTSGAVASGVAGLGLAERPSDVLSLQALSAVGQPQLMAAYNNALKQFLLVGAQVLLVPHDFVDRQQYLHARDTIGRLLELGCIPIINENDAIANNEIRYGDNDHLAALLAHLVSADMLVLLTDTAGLYTSDPRTNSDATVISVVAADDPLLSVSASGAGSDRGSGGMASKLAAARIASWSGVTAVIAAAVIIDLDLELLVYGIPMPGWLYLVIYLAVSIYLSKRGKQNINHSAHISGAVVAVFAGFLIVEFSFTKFGT